MDRARLCKHHLAVAERHVATARRNVDQQRDLVVALARDGHATDRAISLLDVYEQLLDMHIDDRDRLRAELPRLRQGEIAWSGRATRRT